MNPNRASCLTIASALSLLGLYIAGNPAAATAQTRSANAAENRAHQRWTPGLSFVAGAIVNERQGEISSMERGADDGESRVPVAFIGIGGELSTPAFSDDFGRPRFFVHTDVSWSFDTDEGLVNQDEPGVPDVPPINNFPVLGVANQGQALRAEASPLMLSAGAGMSFELEAFDRNFRIKPSIDWVWQRDKLTLLLGHAESEGANPDFCSPCRTVSIDTSTEKSFHSLGPGLEIEMDTGRSGDFLWTLYMSGHAYHLLTDRKVDLQSMGTWTTNGAPSAGRAPTTLSGSYERDTWSYRFAVGLRLLWQPEE